MSNVFSNAFSKNVNSECSAENKSSIPLVLSDKSIANDSLDTVYNNIASNDISMESLLYNSFTSKMLYSLTNEDSIATGALCVLIRLTYFGPTINTPIVSHLLLANEPTSNMNCCECTEEDVLEAKTLDKRAKKSKKLMEKGKNKKKLQCVRSTKL